MEEEKERHGNEDAKGEREEENRIRLEQQEMERDGEGGLSSLLSQSRLLSTSCRRFKTPDDSVTSLGKDKSPKPGILKRAAIKTHHATIWLLNRISPKARVFYERFIDGATSFMQDFRYVYSLNKRLKNKEFSLEDLSWEDLYKKLQMKQDVAKVLPVLVIVNIPFVYYVTLPIVLYFQRIFLSDHFITAEDVASNHGEHHKRRRVLYPQIMKALRRRVLRAPTSEQTKSLAERISESQLEKSPFTADDLLSHRDIFSRQAALSSLSRNHLKYLCKLHAQWILFAPNVTLRKRLSTHALMISLMDRAVLKSGLDHVEDLDLRKLCNQRGFNPVGSERQDLVKWLTEWGQISTQITDEEKSLLLHASILLVTGRPHQGDASGMKPATEAA
ncbi:LETM1 domain-containing protein 1-like [Diadema antillarum]|uniref:LETM1 domain-containing protein 1-like n=1 Tax=Diadema antillarum TaxID=105358 RepID=UPI003A84E2B9